MHSKMSNWLRALACALTLCAFTLGLAPAAKANTIISFPGNMDYCCFGPNSGFGPPNTNSFGQTFTAPSDPILVDFRFYLYGGVPTNYVAQVYEWSGSSLIGSAVWTSPTETSPSDGGYVTYTAGVTLTPGQLYMIVLTDRPDGTSLGPSNGYFGVATGFSGNPPAYFTENAPLNGGWQCAGGSCSSPESANFLAEFTTATPLPGALPLFASGLGALGLIAWRRKRRVLATA